MIINYRFLDPVLASKYDCYGFARAFFSFVGFDESPNNGPRTIIVQRNIMEELRKIVLNIMTSNCTNSYERDTIMPKIVANASFNGELVTRISCGSGVGHIDNHDSVNNRLGNAIELKTCEDVRSLLQGFYEGADLTIWIDASPLDFLPRPPNNEPSPPPSSTQSEKENKVPNKISGLPCSSKRAVSSSLKAIAKAGNIKLRSARKSTPTKEATKLGSIHSSSTMIPNQVGNGVNGKNTFLVDHAPTPGFPIFSEFCCGALDDSTRSVSTTSAATISSITSNLTYVLLSDNKDEHTIADDDSKNDETRKILALAGCPGYGEFDGLYNTSNHKTDNFLSGHWIADSRDKETSLYQCLDCNSILQANSAHHRTAGGYDNNHIVLLRDEGMYQCLACYTILPTNSIHHYTVCPQGFKHFVRVSGDNTLEKHLTPSFFETKSSLSSVSTFGEGTPIGEGDVTFFREQCTPFVHSSSLLEGREREIAGILESVLDSVFETSESDGNAVKADDNDLDGSNTGGGHPKSFDPTVLNIPCPTPKELLQMTLG